MNHYKSPYFSRKKQYKCNNYRIQHALCASFQNQLSEQLTENAALSSNQFLL